MIVTAAGVSVSRAPRDGETKAGRDITSCWIRKPFKSCGGPVIFALAEIELPIRNSVPGKEQA